MSGPKASGGSPRIGTQLRTYVSSTYGKADRRSADLVLHYSHKAGKDVALSGQREYLHFLRCESDPEIRSVDYAPQTKLTQLAGAPVAELVHAVVTLRSGEVVWRRLIAKDPDSAPTAPSVCDAVQRGQYKEVSRLETLSREQLVANPERLRNSLRALAWISAARHWPLADHKRAVIGLLRTRRSASFGEVLSLAEGAERALFAAAVLTLEANGAVRSDLDALPLSTHTNFWRTGGEQ